MFYSEFSKVTLFRESFACWSPWLKLEGCRLGIGTWCGRFLFLGRRQKVLMKNTLDFLPCNDHPLVFFDGWRNCQQFLLRTVDVSWSWWASHLVCDWHRWFMDFPHWCYRIPLDTFRQIATTWPRQQRISLVGSGTDPRNIFPECVEKGSRLGSPGGEVFVSKNKQIRASVQRKCWIVCEGKMGTKQHR